MVLLARCLAFLALAAGFGEVLAANITYDANQFPQCSRQCLDSILAAAPTVAQNFKLLCANVTLEKSIVTCVLKSCNFSDQQEVARLNSKLCENEPVQTRVLLGTLVPGVLGVLMQMIIFLRLYTRKKVAVALGIGLDDYLILAAGLIIFVAMISGTLDIFVFGLGRHTFNVDPKNYEGNFILFWVDEIAYQAAMTFVKASILCFYLRLFPDPRFRIIVYVMLVFVTLTGIAFAAVTIFQCTPIRGVFDKGIEFHCLDTNTATYASSGFSIVIDFTILAMPIPQLLKLRVPRGKRNAVLVTFSFGFIAAAISIIRLPFIIQFGETTDPLYDNVQPGIWTLTEMSTAVIAACLPALRPLADKLFPRFFGDLELPHSKSNEDWPVDFREHCFAQAPGRGPILDDCLEQMAKTEVERKKSCGFYHIRDGKIEMNQSRFSKFSVNIDEGGWDEI